VPRWMVILAISSPPGGRPGRGAGPPGAHSAAGCGPWSAGSRRWGTTRSRYRPVDAGPARALAGSGRVEGASERPPQGLVVREAGTGRIRPGLTPAGDLERGVVVELALALAVGGALGLGDGPAQRGGDLIGLDLDHRPLVALGGLPAAALEPADDHGPVALAEGLGDVLGQLPPDVGVGLRRGAGLSAGP